jgi:hypothetical protein
MRLLFKFKLQRQVLGNGEQIRTTVTSIIITIIFIPRIKLLPLFTNRLRSRYRRIVQVKFQSLTNYLERNINIYNIITIY